MKKSTRLLRKLVALVLVLLLSIESFGAVLSDNDGSAFITKAEFDSLRNDFQAQVDQYNQSIDSKIDGAIAQYLAGINIQTPPDNYYDRLKSVIGNKNPYFLRLTKTGTNAITSNVIVSKAKNYSVKYLKQQTTTIKITNEPVIITVPSQMGAFYLWVIFWDNSIKDNSTMNAWNYAMNLAGGKISLPCWTGKKVSWAYGTDGTTQPTTWTETAAGTAVPVKSDWKKNNNNAMFLHIKLSSLAKGENTTCTTEYGTYNGVTMNKGESRNFSIGVAKPADSSSSTTTTVETNTPVMQTATRAGSGEQWTYESNPDGSKSLKRYWTTFYPQQLITLNFKNYKDGGTKTEVKKDDFKETAANTYTASITPKYGRVAVGTNHTSYGTQNNVGYCEEIFSLITESTDSDDYRTAQWGTGTANNIYASTESPTLVAKNDLLNAYTDLAASTVTIGGVTHATTKVTNNVHEVSINPETLPLNTFVNSYYTGIAGEPVRMGYGIPIMRANADLGTKYNIKVKMKMSEISTGNGVIGNVNCKLSNNHFVDGNFATTADKLYESTYNITSSVENTLTIPLNNIPKGQQVWLNIYPAADGRKVEVTGFDVTIS